MTPPLLTKTFLRRVVPELLVLLSLHFGLVARVGAESAPGATPDARPNIILFVTDDESPIAGCYGNPVIKTPNLDALAADGTRFTNAFATTASCSASRSVILSGIHNHANGQYGHVHDFHHFQTFHAIQAVSLPLQLEQLGYRTAQIGKYHIAPESVFHFETYLKGPGRNAVAMADNCRSFLSEKNESPFFLYFCTDDPHRSELEDESSPSKFKPNLFGNLPGHQQRPGVKEVFYDPKTVLVPGFLPDSTCCREELAQYYQAASRVDQGLGELIRILKDTGKWENTVIIFTGDHGMAFPGAKTTVYDAGLKVPFVVRDPRVAAHGVVNSAMLSHLDITPSILDLAGGYDAATGAPKHFVKLTPAEKFENVGVAPKQYQGRSWVGLLGATGAAGWDHVFFSHTFHEIQMYYPMRSYRGDRYKIIWNIAYELPYPFASDLWAASTWQEAYENALLPPVAGSAPPAARQYAIPDDHEKSPDDDPDDDPDPPGNNMHFKKDAMYGPRTIDSYIHRPQFELYDVIRDPWETKNLSGDPAFAEILKTYKARLKAEQLRTNDPWVMKWSYE